MSGKKKTPKGTKQGSGDSYKRKVKVRAAVQLKQKVTATKAVTTALKECGWDKIAALNVYCLLPVSRVEWRGRL